MSEVQAAEIRLGGGVFWGVRYHPEYRLRDIAAVVRRYGEMLVTEGFFKDLSELEFCAADPMALEAGRKRRDIAWRLDLGEDILDEGMRLSELSNWITSQVRR